MRDGSRRVGPGRGAGRDEPDDLVTRDLGPARGGLGADALDDPVRRRERPVLDVHRHLDKPGRRQVETERADPVEASAPLPNDLGDLLRRPRASRAG